MFLHNIKLTFRKLKANKLYSFLNIAGFAIGFAVVLIITLFIYNEITVDHNFNEFNRIYRLILSDENDSFIRFEISGGGNCHSCSILNRLFLQCEL